MSDEIPLFVWTSVFGFILNCLPVYCPNGNTYLMEASDASPPNFLTQTKDN
jgi:hypothetical protein